MAMMTQAPANQMADDGVYRAVFMASQGVYHSKVLKGCGCKWNGCGNSQSP